MEVAHAYDLALLHQVKVVNFACGNGRHPSAETAVLYIKSTRILQNNQTIHPYMYISLHSVTSSSALALKNYYITLVKEVHY